MDRDELVAKYTFLLFIFVVPSICIDLVISGVIDGGYLLGGFSAFCLCALMDVQSS